MNVTIKHYSQLFSKGLILAGGISLVLLSFSFFHAFDLYEETQIAINGYGERIQLTT